MKTRRLDIRRKKKLALVAVAILLGSKDPSTEWLSMNQVMSAAENAGGEYREIHSSVYGYGEYLPAGWKTTWVGGYYAAVRNSYTAPVEVVAGQDAILKANSHLCAADFM